MTFEERAEAFKQELIALEDKYSVELESDAWDGTCTLDDKTDSRKHIFNFEWRTYG